VFLNIPDFEPVLPVIYLHDLERITHMFGIIMDKFFLWPDDCSDFSNLFNTQNHPEYNTTFSSFYTELNDRVKHLIAANTSPNGMDDKYMGAILELFNRIQRQQETLDGANPLWQIDNVFIPTITVFLAHQRSGRQPFVKTPLRLKYGRNGIAKIFQSFYNSLVELRNTYGHVCQKLDLLISLLFMYTVLHFVPNDELLLPDSLNWLIQHSEKHTTAVRALLYSTYRQTPEIYVSNIVLYIIAKYVKGYFDFVTFDLTSIVEAFADVIYNACRRACKRLRGKPSEWTGVLANLRDYNRRTINVEMLQAINRVGSEGFDSASRIIFTPNLPPGENHDCKREMFDSLFPYCFFVTKLVSKTGCDKDQFRFAHAVDNTIRSRHAYYSHIFSAAFLGKGKIQNHEYRKNRSSLTKHESISSKVEVLIRRLFSYIDGHIHSEQLLMRNPLTYEYFNELSMENSKSEESLKDILQLLFDLFRNENVSLFD